MRCKVRRIRQFLCFASILCASSPLFGANWQISPVIEVQEVYTDNHRLAADGSKAEEFITVITPGLSLRNVSTRTDMQLDYSMQNLLYANDGDNNDMFHLLRVSATGEILKEHLFLDTSLDRSSQNTGSGGNPALDNLNISSQRSTIMKYKISPYWEQRLGRFAELNARYTRDKVESGSFNNSDADKVQVRLSSGTSFNSLRWDIKFDHNKVNTNRDRTTRKRNIRLNLRYLLSRKLALITESGYDDNSFDSTSGDVSGILWNFGFEWNPSKRTSLMTTYGQRFFGDDIVVNFSHRSKRTRTQLKFSKIPRTTRSLLLEQQVFNLTDAFGTPLDGLAQDQVADLDLSVPQQTAEILISSAIDADFEFLLKKHSFSAAASYKEFEYQLSGDTEYRRNASFGWHWNLAARTRSSLNFRWIRDNKRRDRDERYLILDYSLSHSLSEDMDVSLNFRHVDRESAGAFLPYRENRVFATLSRRF